LTVADVPGLLEGAHEGVGLGDEFLAHLERARLLVHVIDVTEPAEARFAAIDRELHGYGAGLVDRPQIVVLNKVDLLDESPEFRTDDARVLAVVPLSAATGTGVAELERALFELVPRAAPEPAAEEELVDFMVYRPRPDRRRPFRLFRTDQGFRVRGQATEDELRAAGVKPGDQVEYE
jgi:GTP-binding protein